VFLREELNVSLEAHLADGVWSRIQSLRAIAKKLEEDENRRWAERAETYRKMSKKDLRRLGEREPYHPKHNPDPQNLSIADPARNRRLFFAVNSVRQSAPIRNAAPCRARGTVQRVAALRPAMVYAASATRGMNT
jgi:hypothetical protein